MKIDKIREICAQAFRLFTYRPDPQFQDTWISYAEKVKTNQHFTGDCDDITSTILDLLDQNGCPADHMWRMMVRTENASNAGPDHFIGVVQDDDDKKWVVGDTYNHQPYPLSILSWQQIRNSPCTGILWYNTKLR